MQNLERATRYNTKSLPPPNLKKIVTTLQKQARKFDGTLPNSGNIVRGLLKKADKDEYDRRGRADDGYRFLRNHGILLLDEAAGRYYIDEQQAHAILLACEKHTEAPEAPDPQERLLALRPPPKQNDECLDHHESGEFALEPIMRDDMQVSEHPVETASSSISSEIETAASGAPYHGSSSLSVEFLSPQDFLKLSLEEARAYLNQAETRVSAYAELLPRLEKVHALKQRRRELEHQLTKADEDIKELMTL